MIHSTLKRRISFILIAMLAVVLVASCASVGKKFPTDPVKDITIGKTTMTDINRMFGLPWRTGIEDGRKTWTYGYYRYKLFGTTMTRDLVVKFNNDGTVYSYSYNTSEVEE